MNAINCSATRRKTLHCGINQGINLDNVKSGISSIQFEIGFHHQHCLHTIFSISIVVQMFLTLRFSTVMASLPALRQPRNKLMLSGKLRRESR